MGRKKGVVWMSDGIERFHDVFTMCYVQMCRFNVLTNREM